MVVIEQHRPHGLLEAVIFGGIALLTFAAGAAAIGDGVRYRSWPLAIFGSGVLTIGGLLTYETAALAFGWRTLSQLTNQQYLSHLLLGLLSIALTGAVYGLLSGHFTTRAGHFDLRIAAVVTLMPFIGYLVALVSGWKVE